MVPRLKLAVITSKVILVILASLFGVFGLFIGITLLHVHLYSIDTFGLDYLYPVSRFSVSSLKDTLMRAPWWKMITRPKIFTNDVVRQRRKND